MSLSQAISSVFKNYANFNGRARRSEFWFFELFNLIIYLAVSIIDYFVTGGSDSLSFISILYWLYNLGRVGQYNPCRRGLLHGRVRESLPQPFRGLFNLFSFLSSAGSSFWHGGQRTATWARTDLVLIPRDSTPKTEIKRKKHR